MIHQGDQSFLQVGRVGRSHGLDGSFFVSDRSEPVPFAYKSLSIGDRPESSRRVALLLSREHNQRFLVRCDWPTDPEGVKAVTGQQIWVERSVVAVDEQRQYLWADIESKLVEDARGETVGRVIRVYNLGASDVVTIRDEERRRSIDLPLIGSYFDMSFTAASPALRLVVAVEVFHELWQQPSS